MSSHPPQANDLSIPRLAFASACPRCGRGALYRSRLSLEVAESCSSCGLSFAPGENADGPAVLVIFLLGCLLVPLALLTEKLFAPPLWVHAVVWGGVAMVLALWALRPLKAALIAFQYRCRPEDWGL